jgi:hypothetical protein
MLGDVCILPLPGAPQTGALPLLQAGRQTLSHSRNALIWKNTLKIRYIRPYCNGF